MGKQVEFYISEKEIEILFKELTEKFNVIGVKYKSVHKADFFVNSLTHRDFNFLISLNFQNEIVFNEFPHLGFDTINVVDSYVIQFGIIEHIESLQIKLLRFWFSEIKSSGDNKGGEFINWANKLFKYVKNKYLYDKETCCYLSPIVLEAIRAGLFQPP